jgi:membrane protein DedA with SNARE-associated domain
MSASEALSERIGRATCSAPLECRGACITSQPRASASPQQTGTGDAVIHTALGAIGGFIVGTISALGYGGVLALMAIESACIPLPSEIILPFAGYLVSTGRFDLYLVAIAGALGCNVGSTAAYALGFYGGRPLVEGWGRVLIGRHELLLVNLFFARWGGVTVLLGRMLPVVRTFIALPAGLGRMPWLRFQIYTFVGSLPWCFLLAYAGMRLGQAWDSDPRLRALMHRLDLAAIGLLVLGVVCYGIHLWRARVR